MAPKPTIESLKGNREGFLGETEEFDLEWEVENLEFNDEGLRKVRDFLGEFERGRFVVWEGKRWICIAGEC